MIKKCSNCGIEKEVNSDNFTTYKKYIGSEWTDRFAPECKECKKKKAKIKRDKIREKELKEFQEHLQKYGLLEA